jgi:hypothetical protein
MNVGYGLTEVLTNLRSKDPVLLNQRVTCEMLRDIELIIKSLAVFG